MPVVASAPFQSIQLLAINREEILQSPPPPSFRDFPTGILLNPDSHLISLNRTDQLISRSFWKRLLKLQHIRSLKHCQYLEATGKLLYLATLGISAAVGFLSRRVSAPGQIDWNAVK